MAELLLKQTWHLRLLTPIHIGCGETLWHDFDWVTAGKETLVLDKDRIWEAALPKEEDAPIDLGLLRRPPAQLVDPEELGADSPYVLYRLRGTPRGEEVLAQTKYTWRQPYIPGSSLKGAIRTVLLWEAVRTGRVQVLERDLDRRRERAAQKIEQQAFGSDPNHDLLRALRVGDRRPLSLESLRLLNVYVFSSGGGDQDQRIPIDVEAISHNQETSAPVTIDNYLLREPSLGFQARADWLTSELPSIARRWAEDRLGAEVEFYQRQGWQSPLTYIQRLKGALNRLSGQDFLMQFGWGTGWGAKTIGSLLPSDLRDRVIQRYRLSRGSHSPGAPFPRSRRLRGRLGTYGSDPDYPLGWVRVRIRDSVRLSEAPS